MQVGRVGSGTWSRYPPDVAKSTRAKSQPTSTSSREAVIRAAIDRTHGASALHTFGYRELSEILGAGLGDIVLAVLDECFDPMSLVEIAIAKRHGLPWLREQRAKITPAWRTILQARPATVREVCAVRPPPLPVRYGLDTLWAYGYPDLAAQTHRPPDLGEQEWLQRVWNEAKPARSGFSLDNLASVVSWVAQHQRPAIKQLTE